MELEGENELAASCETIWAAINDLEVLRAITSGCQKVTRNAAHDHDAPLQVKVSRPKTRFEGQVHLGDVEQPDRCRIVGEGQAGVAGFDKDDAAVKRLKLESGILVRWQAKPTISGKLAHIGSRVVKGVAAKLAAQFFANLSNHFANELQPAGAAMPTS